MMPLEAWIVATSRLKVGERVTACSLSRAIEASVERTRRPDCYSVARCRPSERTSHDRDDSRGGHCITQMVVWAHDVLPAGPLDGVLTTGGKREVKPLQDQQNQAENPQMEGRMAWAAQV